VEAQYRRALDPGRRESEPVEFRVLRRDGEMRWVLSSGAAVFEDGPEGPRAVRYLGALQDITERRAIEEAQRKAVRRLRLAMEAGRMAVWETEVATGRIAGSAELNRLLGFPEDEPLDPAAVRARYAPGERERLAGLGLAAMARGESSFEAEFRYLRAPDDPRWLRLRCDILFNAERRPEKAIGVVFDETDRRRAEEELRASEARLQLASAALGAGVWDRDLLTGEVVWSPEEFALLGVDPATPPDRLPPPGGRRAARGRGPGGRADRGHRARRRRDRRGFPRAPAGRRAALDPDARHGRAGPGRAACAGGGHRDRRHGRARARGGAGGAQPRAFGRGRGAAARAGAASTRCRRTCSR
jgi:PAS domain-containing protein